MRSVVLSAMLAMENIKFEVFLIYTLALVALLLQVVSLHAADNPSGSLTRPASITSNQPLITAAEKESEPEPKTESSSPAGGDIELVQHSPSNVWPMRGRVTVEFGVPHRPWQSRHTGIDIVSGSRSGAMPISPFAEGRVVRIIHSSRGLGNHVIIDHGENMTSVYAHLSRINVSKGQHVKPGDTLGYEGRSGATTGRHLHFEIRVNNTPKNPRNFIKGSPHD